MKKSIKYKKTHKEEELAGLWSWEAQSGIEITSSTIPAALIPSHNLILPAAEVFQESPQNPPTPTATKPIERRPVSGEKLKPPVILSSDKSDLEKSTPPKSPQSTASSRRGTVLTEGSEQEDEVYRWEKLGNPTPSPRARARGSNSKPRQFLEVKSHRSSKPENTRQEPVGLALRRRNECRESEYRTEGPRAATLLESQSEEEAAEATVKLESGHSRREIPEKVTVSMRYVDRLKGGSLKDIGEKRKIKEEGDKEESKSKYKPQDFKDYLEKYSGLVKLGSTCYLNAVLQCLARCPVLVNTLDKNPTSDDAENKITAHLREVFQTINREGRTTPYSPSEIHSAILRLSLCSGWKKDQQQDVAELLQIVIEKLQEENSQVGKLFEGWQRSSTKCQTCKNTSIVDDAFTRSL